MDRYVCIHGHFYQPPRENPWLESVELQEAAYPYHDWNERINAECYAPNGASRILDARDRIVRIVNNYSWISFNFGPTLLAWLKDHTPETYAQVLQADGDSAQRFGGHGSALAQHYNHMIMPLANGRDKRTQTIWGLRDFAFRFGRPAEGMWLPETAVDLESLDLMAELGVRFTILAPSQAAAVRRTGAIEWRQLEGARIDTTRPYLQRLPSGREIAIFFYDGPTARAVAFEGLLRDGERFAQHLLAVFGDQRETGIAHIATDGETYGHHHRHGDMALAYALHRIEQGETAQLTNYGEYLHRHPPQDEVRIIESTSWSCAHGVERWRSDCGCHTGGQADWNQRWREPLRASLDWLRDTLTPAYERSAAELLHDPWAARDDYIDVILDRSPPSRAAFLERHAQRELEPAERVRAFKLLELQRHAMLMYTSCGWFFNDLSGIETVQVLRYAGRAVQLAQELFGNGIEGEFLQRLAQAHSNLPDLGDGRRIYETQVRPAVVDLLRVVAHYAVDSLLANEGHDRIYCYTVRVQHQERRQLGDAKLFVGRAQITSEVTQEVDLVTFAVLHFGSHNFTGGIRRFRGDKDYNELSTGLVEAFEQADTARVVNLLARFPEYTFSLKSLFSDRQREILQRLLQASVAEAETAYRGVYERDASLMRFLIDLDLPIPRAFLLAAEYIINLELRRAFEAHRPNIERARSLMHEATTLELQLDTEGLAFTVQNAMERLALAFRDDPNNLETLSDLAQLTATAKSLSFDVSLWRVQNLYYEMVQQIYPDWNDRARTGDISAEQWVALFSAVGEQLSVAVE